MTPPSPIRCLGLSHATAPVAVRERVSVSAERLPELLARARADRRLGPVVVLSTCNRVEVYAAPPDADGGEGVADALAALLVEQHGLEARALAEHLYHHEGDAAVRHLFRVATGLDSIVLGEPQILGQVAAALAAARAAGRLPRSLGVLFERALRAGKRARHETRIGHRPSSTASVALRLAGQAAGGLAGRHVAVVGTGEIGRLAVKGLARHGAARLTVVNRTAEAAAALAAASAVAHAEARPLADLPAVLAEADVVLAATGAAEPVVTAAAIRAAVETARAGRPLVLVDLGLPRNVEPAARALPGVALFDVDDLRGEVDASLAARRAEVPRVEAIVAEELAAFAHWQRQAAVEPVIRDLRLKAERIRRAELDRLRGPVGAAAAPDAGAPNRAEAFSRALVNKLLHDLTRTLRASAASGHAAHADAVRDLFGLADPPGHADARPEARDGGPEGDFGGDGR